jgi:hypothetical protein
LQFSFSLTLPLTMQYSSRMKASLPLGI